MVMKDHKGYRPKQRNTGSRKERSIVLLSTEGKNKTETRYFTDLARHYGLNIQFAPGNYTDPVNMMKALIQECEKKELEAELGDKAFCLVDSDVDPHKNEQLSIADSMSGAKMIQLIVSSPCFEVWVLCHFSRSIKHPNSSSSVVDDVLKVLPGYSKDGEGLFRTLAPSVEEAVKKAKDLERQCVNAGYRPHTVEFSPSTEIYKVIESLLSLGA